MGHLEHRPPAHLRVERIAQIPTTDRELPIHSFALGSEATTAPCIAFVAGIHGLERIGSEVVFAFLNSVLQRIEWDNSLIEALEKIKLMFIPTVNPVGVLNNTRSNGNHVDLMRNAPLDAEMRPPFLGGGHRIHRRLPWYRGRDGGEMEIEAQALCQTIRKHCFQAPFSLVLDCHSGFGFDDHLWFPYAYSKKPIAHLPEVYALKQLLNQTYPHLDYRFEPQSISYTTHGDLWDYLYLESQSLNTCFLPLTMEMGSWRWIKKNPRQLASVTGLFNPILPHRLKRVLRRHTVLMEFLLRACYSWQQWIPHESERENLRKVAGDHWYSKSGSR